MTVPLFLSGSFGGGYVDYFAIDSSLVVPIPGALSLEAATALMMQGLTALYLTKQVPPRGKTVLVNAASDGVGSLLLQLTKRAGAKTVIAGASADRKLDFARSLGADAGVNYTRSDWVQLARAASGENGPDIIYESVGGAVTPAATS